MTPMMLLAAGGRVLVTKTFTSNETFVVPLTTVKLDTMSGKGAAGSAGYYYTDTVSYIDKYTSRTSYFNDGTQSTTYNNQPISTTQSWSKPADYCDPYVALGQPNIGDAAGYQDCYTHTQRYVQEDAYQPATTGASTTGFGKTFPGGDGGAASTTTFNNVAVTPGASYNVVVPSGGTLTITYWR